MRTRSTHLATALSLAVVLLLTGCGDEDGAADGTTPPTAPATSPTTAPSSGVPDREPDVTGLVGFDGATATAPVLAEPSDTYYTGMSLVTDGTVVVDAAGGTVAASDLAAGDQVAVWIEGGCAESYPVQCQVVAVQVVTPARLSSDRVSATEQVPVTEQVLGHRRPAS